MKQAMSVLVSQSTNEWYTPPHIIERARATMGGIDLDPASNDTAQQWIRATDYYTADTLISGLAMPWHGRVWLNPPFDSTPAWVEKLGDEYRGGNVVSAVLLVNSAPGYVWWERLTDACPIVMLRERLRFIRPDGTPGGQAKKGQTVAYYGLRPQDFVRHWRDLGRIIYP